jgi:hypothetical protein
MTTFILIHGTFAKSADWPALQRGVAEATRNAGEEARFHQVPWTGWNRASARQAAAASIASAVQQIQVTSPSEKLFLIGHSHGGSAIAYFLKEYPSLSKTLAGCAFLSTPFVAIRPRSQAESIILIIVLFPVVLLALLWSFVSGSAHGTAYVIGAALISALIPGCMYLVRRIYTPEKILRDASHQQTANIPAKGEYLFLRCSGDEAAAVLSAAQFIAWLAMKVSQGLELVTGPLMQSRRFLIAVLRPLTIIFVAVCVVFFLRFEPSGFVQPIEFLSRFATESVLIALLLIVVIAAMSRLFLLVAIWFLMTFSVIPLIALLLFFGIAAIETLVAYDLGQTPIGHAVAVLFLSFIVVVVPNLFFLGLLGSMWILATQAFASWAFGWTRFSTGLFVELAIEPLPFGAHGLTHIDWSTSPPDVSGITHSWTYAHPAAIRCIQDWVRERLAHDPD